MEVWSDTNAFIFIIFLGAALVGIALYLIRSK
jgi:hypothetical protein